MTNRGLRVGVAIGSSRTFQGSVINKRGGRKQPDELYGLMKFSDIMDHPDRFVTKEFLKTLNPRIIAVVRNMNKTEDDLTGPLKSWLMETEGDYQEVLDLAAFGRILSNYLIDCVDETAFILLHITHIVITNTILFGGIRFDELPFLVDLKHRSFAQLLNEHLDSYLQNPKRFWEDLIIVCGKMHIPVMYLSLFYGSRFPIIDVVIDDQERTDVVGKRGMRPPSSFNRYVQTITDQALRKQIAALSKSSINNIFARPPEKIAATLFPHSSITYPVRLLDTIRQVYTETLHKQVRLWYTKLQLENPAELDDRALAANINICLGRMVSKSSPNLQLSNEECVQHLVTTYPELVPGSKQTSKYLDMEALMAFLRNLQKQGEKRANSGDESPEVDGRTKRVMDSLPIDL